MTSPNSEFSLDRYADLTARFTADPTARVAQNAVSTTNADKLSLDRQVLTSIDTSVSDKVDTWKVSNQKQSGRCWLFSGLNLLRSHLINDLKLTPDFELSQNYLHFFDKLEKANWFL
ncbi:C1 family peptidase, partial [Propionibacterium freudenreichii]